MASVFTRIVRGELPAEKVYETERELAFLDIHPISEGHTLVVPKREVAHFDELPADELASLIAAVQVVTRGVMRGLDIRSYNLGLNNGAAAGQIVFHVHFHIIPRHEGHVRGFTRGSYPPGRAAEVAERIRQGLREL